MNLPAGFTLVSAPPVRAAIRDELVVAWRAWLLAPTLASPPGAQPVHGGRGGAYRAVLAGGVRAVVRPYRRGGWLGRFVHDTYLGRVPRPFTELVATEAARARGVRAPAVLAARVDGGWRYRGTLVTAELVDMVPVLEAMRRVAGADERAALVRAAGRAVGRLHAAGVFHADLNLDNLLVGADGDAAVLDFDRARLGSAPLAPAACRRNLARLARSRCKLDPAGAIWSEATQAVFEAAYAQTLEGACGS